MMNNNVMAISDELEKLIALRNSGEISAEEFETLKGKLINAGPAETQTVNEVLPGVYTSTPWAGCYFAPALDYMAVEDGESYPKYFLAERSWIEREWQSLPNVKIPVFSYAVISCPRCEILWKHKFGEDEEFDRDAALEDCLSCKGTGEWVFDT